MSPTKVIVVDDDDQIRDIVQHIASDALPSAEIVTYASATQALHEIETGTADLLITNCHMPDMDGPTLVRTVREMKHALPIIMVSGSEDAEKLGQQAGIDRFVAKNLLYTDLSDAIGVLLHP
jgi:DNA-binding response OmpR family regulator